MTSRMNNSPWLVTALLLLLLCGQDAMGRADPPPWVDAKKLAQQIQATTPALSEDERKRFLATFAKLQAQHEALEAEERNLVTRLSADQSDLKSHAEVSAQYEKDRAGWQARLDAHNAQCKRTFTNPVDVARCDQSGNKLASEKETLDSREADIAKRSAELRARQAANLALVGKLDESHAAWSKSLEPDFNAPLRQSLARKTGTTTLRLSVKSFIKVIDLSSMRADSRPRAERMFAWFTNQNFSENPATPASDGRDFRLWSQQTVVATCRGDTITSWKTSQLAHRSGKELQMLDAETSIMEALKVDPSPQGSGELRSINFSYAIKGKPNDAALFSFRAVHPRSCASIWHRVHSSVSCRDGKAQMQTRVSGSRFPSHRAWINEQLVTTLDQAAFSTLWDCDPSAPDLVR